MARKTFLTDKMKECIDWGIEAYWDEVAIVENLFYHFDIDMSKDFLIEQIGKKIRGEKADWKKIVGGLND